MKKMSLAILVFAACGLSATAQQSKTAKKKIAAFDHPVAVTSTSPAQVALRTQQKITIENKNAQNAAKPLQKRKVVVTPQAEMAVPVN